MDQGQDNDTAERDWVEQAMTGDTAAFDCLVLAHQARLSGFLARYVRETADIFDLVQEIFIRAWQGLAQLDSPAAFPRWLNGIAKHVVHDHLRQRHYRNSDCQLRLDEDMLALLPLSDANPQHDELEAAAVQALRRCLGDLPQSNRDLLRWRFVEGRQVRHIARELTRKETAISMALIRLRERLQDCVQRRLRQVEL